MKLSFSSQYSASTRQVAEILAEPGFAAGSMTFRGITVQEATVTGTPDAGFTVIVRRSVSAQQLPKQARAVVSNGLNIRQVNAWEPPVREANDQEAWAGTINIEISGAPVKANGSIRLTPTADGCELAYDGEVKAMIPLLGARLEKAAQPYIDQFLQAEHDAIIARLGE